MKKVKKIIGLSLILVFGLVIGQLGASGPINDFPDPLGFNAKSECRSSGPINDFPDPLGFNVKSECRSSGPINEYPDLLGINTNLSSQIYNL